MRIDEKRVIDSFMKKKIFNCTETYPRLEKVKAKCVCV